MMSLFVYFDANQKPVAVQRFDTPPEVAVQVPQGVIYIQDAGTLTDLDILENWRMKGGVLTDVGPNPGPSWRWDIQESGWVVDLPRAKANKWAAIKERRRDMEFGLLQWGGSTFDIDPLSQSRIQGAVQLAALSAASERPFSIDWTLANNAVRTLSATDVIEVGAALAAHVQSVHSTGRDLRSQIESATTVEEVDAIDWPAQTN